MSDKKPSALELAENLKVRAAEIGDAARAGAEAAYETMVNSAEDGLDAAHRYLKRQWRERPVTVAAAAVGVGVILGMLIASRRR